MISMARMWQPILDGRLADDARQAVLDIARALAGGAGHPPKPTDAALFWAYVAGALDDDWIAASYDDAIVALGEHAARGFDNTTLFYGAAGVGFAIAHVSEPGTVEDSLRVIDELIAQELAVERWTGSYDLISGLVGIGVYLLERGDVPSARLALDRLVGHLSAMSEVTPDGVAWYTPHELLPTNLRAAWPDGHFNCGLAHGVPGVAALLGRVAALPDADPRHRALAEATLRWVVAQQLPPNDRNRYPTWFGRGGTGTPTRTAWCYGDPGVAIATLGASTRLGLSTVDALALARECASRPFENCGVEDAGLCHGAAGLAHIFNRCFQASGEPALRDAARTWFQRALDMRRPDGVGGFLAWMVSADNVRAWLPTTSILEGPTGIALALLGALEPTEPSWDRLLLCDVP